MSIARTLFVAWLALGAGPMAAAAVTSSVVNLPAGNGSQRYLVVSDDAPVANLLVLPDGSGFLDLQPDGGIPDPWTRDCAAFVRNRLAFAERGFAITFANQISADLPAAVAYLKARNGAPVWIVGGNSATATAVFWAADLPPEPRVGLILYSTLGLLPPDLATLVTRPVLLLYHLGDPGTTTTAIHLQLDQAPVREITGFGGGVDGGCGGFPDFQGIDAQFRDMVTSFIERHNDKLQPTQPGEVIEYYHAGFEHYFTTALPAEIALLDGGAFGGAFRRTGRGYKAWDTQEAGTEPVCRFFTVTFAPKSSHFYTAYPFECDIVKTNPDWQYEGTPYYSKLPVGGTCPGGTIPVYRMFNNGQSGAPNHRFTTDLALYDQFVSQRGWAGEGVVFCAKP